MLALPAVELLKKFVEPPNIKMFTWLPAVALFENTIVPPFPKGSVAVMKFCVIPELFAMPIPLMVSVTPGLAVMGCRDSRRQG